MIGQRPFYFGTNLKMFPTADESAAFARDLHPALARWEADAPISLQTFIIPPFTSLAGLRGLLGATWLGAQTMHDAPSGAHTGEISARMLTAHGVDLVMLGHAERRAQFGETDAALRRKVRAALDAGLRVLLCIGEDAFERECNVSHETVTRQLKIALRDVRADEVGIADPRVLIAYEPVWAIGASGTPAAADMIAPVIAAIRAALTECYSERGDTIPILYGGSVTADNAASYAQIMGVDGLFVGRAAWTVDGFMQVLQIGWRASRDARIKAEPPRKTE